MCFRLKDLSDKISKHGLTSSVALQNVAIHQVVIGPSHIAVLLQVCFQFNVFRHVFYGCCCCCPFLYFEGTIPEEVYLTAAWDQ